MKQKSREMIPWQHYGGIRIFCGIFKVYIHVYRGYMFFQTETIWIKK